MIPSESNLVSKEIEIKKDEKETVANAPDDEIVENEDAIAFLKAFPNHVPGAPCTDREVEWWFDLEERRSAKPTVSPIPSAEQELPHEATHNGRSKINWAPLRPGYDQFGDPIDPNAPKIVVKRAEKPKPWASGTF